MNQSALDFANKYNSEYEHIEEYEHIKVSLDHIVDEIKSKINILDLLNKFWIEFQRLPVNSIEWEQYGNSAKNVYTAACPKCHSESTLHIFHDKWFYGCLSCNEWEYVYDRDMNIFSLLSEIDKDVWDETHDKIQRFYDLFPEKLSFLEWKHLNRYTYYWDVFDFSDKYHPDLQKEFHSLEEEMKKVPQEYNYLEPLRQKIKPIRTILVAHRIVSQIYERKERIGATLFGKSLEEVAWYQIVDENAEWNNKLLDLLSDVRDFDDSVSDTLFPFETPEQIEKRLRELREAEAREIKQEEERVRQESERLERVEQTKRILSVKSENLNSLFDDFSKSQTREIEFLESCTYTTHFEWDLALENGDFGKLVMIFNESTSTFSIVYGKRKTQSVPLPKLLNEASEQTRSSKMPADVGLHRDIAIPSGCRVLWWAQYIVLPDNTILIGGQSQDYGSICQEITRRCLSEILLKVGFLENANYQSISSIYREYGNTKK